MQQCHAGFRCEELTVALAFAGYLDDTDVRHQRDVHSDYDTRYHHYHDIDDDDDGDALPLGGMRRT